MLCCALFSADGKWYRAVVKEIVSSKQVSPFPSLFLLPPFSLTHMHCLPFTLITFFPLLALSQILVEFVDYGNEEAVERAKLRKKLDHHLFNLPYQVHLYMYMYMYVYSMCTCVCTWW